MELLNNLDQLKMAYHFHSSVNTYLNWTCHCGDDKGSRYFTSWKKQKQVKHTGWLPVQHLMKRMAEFLTPSQQILKHLQINHYASFTLRTFLFKECTPFFCKQKPLQLHTLFIYQSPQLIIAVTYTHLITSRLLLWTAMPLTFCDH